MFEKSIKSILLRIFNDVETFSNILIIILIKFQSKIIFTSNNYFLNSEKVGSFCEKTVIFVAYINGEKSGFQPCRSLIALWSPPIES